MSIIFFIICALCAWLGYILRGAENYHRGYIDGSSERREYESYGKESKIVREVK